MRAVYGGCMNRCVLEEGQTDLCQARENAGDTIVPVDYRKIAPMALDLIKRKPLRRSLSGSVILSAESFGCNLRCPFCQNHEISMVGEGGSRAVPVSPEKLAKKAAGLRIKGNVGVVYTYNEPLVGWECVRNTRRLAKVTGMKDIVVTNGGISDQALDDILSMADAMNVDLKGFTEQYYRKLGGGLETVKHFTTRSSRQCHVKLTTFIIPGEDDSDEEMREMTG